MKCLLLSILVAALLSGCVTTDKGKTNLQTYCPEVPEWPSDLTKPKAVKHEAPPPADRYGVTRACLAVQIDEAGNVTGVQVVHADSPDYGSTFAGAVRRWQFEPARRGSTPVAVTFHVAVESVRSIGAGVPPKHPFERTGGWALPADRKDEVFVFNVYRTGAEALPRSLDGCDFLGSVSATVPEVQAQSIGLFDPSVLLPTIRARAVRKSANIVVVSFAPGPSEYGRRTLHGIAFRCGNQPLPPELGDPLR